MLVRQGPLLVVAIVEGAVRNAHVGFQVVSVRVLAVTVKQSQRSDEVPFLEEVRRIRQFEFLLKWQSGLERGLPVASSRQPGVGA